MKAIRPHSPDIDALGLPDADPLLSRRRALRVLASAPLAGGLATVKPPTLPAGQPEPRQWIVASMPTRDGTVSAITRIWHPGDSRRCRLCDRCCADHVLGVCLVQVKRPVAVQDAPLFSTRGFPVLDRESALAPSVRLVTEGGAPCR